MVLHQPLSTHTYIYIYTHYIYTHISTYAISLIYTHMYPLSALLFVRWYVTSPVDLRELQQHSYSHVASLLSPFIWHIKMSSFCSDANDIIVCRCTWQARCRFCCGIVMCLIFWADVVRGDVSPTKGIWHTCSGASACKTMRKDAHEALELGGVPLVPGSGTKRAETHIVWR